MAENAAGLIEFAGICASTFQPIAGGCPVHAPTHGDTSCSGQNAAPAAAVRFGNLQYVRGEV
ncbi:MAG: hypothetical protein N2111_01580 [Candidatus Sumerlaeaceae bacterium]|nr:hypothetical protein [Candidatus Sumerlaeaceae bacterium]